MIDGEGMHNTTPIMAGQIVDGKWMKINKQKKENWNK